MDTISHYLCKPDGTAIAEKVAKPDEPIKVDDDPNPPACKSCGVPWRDHLGPESQCAELNDRIAALTNERDKLRQQLATLTANYDLAMSGWQADHGLLSELRKQLQAVTRERDEAIRADETQRVMIVTASEQLATLQAELAAMREAIFEKPTDLLTSIYTYVTNNMAVEGTLGSWCSEHARRLYAIERSTAGRELLEEMKRKDEEIKRLTSERDEYYDDRHEARQKLIAAEKKAATLYELRELLRGSGSSQNMGEPSQFTIAFPVDQGERGEACLKMLIAIREGGGA